MKDSRDIFFLMLIKMILFFRSRHRDCSMTNMFIKILQNSKENTSFRVFFNEVADLFYSPLRLSEICRFSDDFRGIEEASN